MTKCTLFMRAAHPPDVAMAMFLGMHIPLQKTSTNSTRVSPQKALCVQPHRPPEVAMAMFLGMYLTSPPRTPVTLSRMKNQPSTKMAVMAWL